MATQTVDIVYWVQNKEKIILFAYRGLIFLKVRAEKKNLNTHIH